MDACSFFKSAVALSAYCLFVTVFTDAMEQKKETMEQLIQQLQQLHTPWASQASRPFAPCFGAKVFGSAFEARTIPNRYSWDGTRRKGHQDHPFIVFQYTLMGWGYFSDGNTVRKMLPQMAFTTVVPSVGHYYLPPESSNWTFCWLIIRHPYVVRRITQRLNGAGLIFTLPANSMLMARMVQILAGIYSGTFHDTFAEEQALFDFLIEYERFVYNLRYSQDKRESLLDEVRLHVLQNLKQPIEIEQLAQRYSMSRSHFSHHFKRITGLAPSQFITQVRLEEATQLLMHTTHTLEIIADETGFANANHFCKVFRRHFYLSPGEFRRQMPSSDSR